MLLAASPLVIAVIAGVVGATALASWYFSPYQKTLRAIRGAPLMRVADAPEGQLVRIVGTLRAGSRALAAPLSGRTCAAYLVKVEERVSRGKRSEWRTVIHDEESADFVVEDETGRAIVRSREVETAIVQDHHQRSGTFEDATPELEAYLARHGQSSTGALLGFNKAMRYVEGVLEPGEIVAVIGLARWEDDPELGAAAPSRGGYRTSARKQRLVLEPSALGPVRASDDPAAQR